MESDLEKLIMDYKNVFGSDSGKRIVADLKKRFEKTGLPMDRRLPVDPYNVVANEAQRLVVKYIVDNIEKNLEELRQKESE